VNRHRILLVVLTAVQIAVSAVLLNSLSRINGWSAVVGEDSTGYLLAAHYFAGHPIAEADVPLLRYRLFNPVIPGLASVLGRFVGIEAGFLLLNVLLWIGTALLLYEMVRRTADEATGFLAAAMFTTAMPMIEWGLPVMLDTGAFFFAVLTVFLFLRWKDDPLSRAAFLGVGTALAILIKPTLLALAVFVGLGWLLERRWLHAVVTGLAAGLLPLAWYLGMGLGIDDFTRFGSPRHQGIAYLALAAFFCFHWGWLFVYKGWREETAGLRRTYAVYFLAFLLTFLPFVHSPRLFFLSFPAVIPLIAKGIRATGKERSLLGGWIGTSNLLAVFHLYVMRTLAIRDLEQLREFFSFLF
jgi:4-amino-4-deoxy-L-arabinose transferase-like glycosyltransferase